MGRKLKINLKRFHPIEVTRIEIGNQTIAFMLVLLSLTVGVRADSEELLGHYATMKPLCRKADQLYEFRRGVIDGPEFHCIMGNPHPGASEGLEDYDSKCRIGGDTRIGLLTLDLAGKPDLIRVKLPEGSGWIGLNRCE
ncbi:MAG: hypothetical protein ACREDO_01390 [Methyloceanibacter sp.]